MQHWNLRLTSEVTLLFTYSDLKCCCYLPPHWSLSFFPHATSLIVTNISSLIILYWRINHDPALLSAYQLDLFHTVVKSIWSAGVSGYGSVIWYKAVRVCLTWGKSWTNAACLSSRLHKLRRKKKKQLTATILWHIKIRQSSECISKLHVFHALIQIEPHLLTWFSLCSLYSLIHLLLHLTELHWCLVLCSEKESARYDLQPLWRLILCSIMGHHQILLQLVWWHLCQCCKKILLCKRRFRNSLNIAICHWKAHRSIWLEWWMKTCFLTLLCDRFPNLLMARARFSISEFCCLISLVKLMMTFSNWGISLGSVRLIFWYNVAACSCLKENQIIRYFY